MLKKQIQLSLPMGVQEMMIAIGWSVFYKIMAMIGKSKVHSFMLHSGMTLTSLDASAFKNKDENFGFLFQLGHYRAFYPLKVLQKLVTMERVLRLLGVVPTPVLGVSEVRHFIC